MENPEWASAQNFGRWTGHIPKFISQYEEEGEKVIVPRGILVHLVEDLGYSWEINDERVATRSEAGWPQGNIQLRPGDQEPALQELLSWENGFLIYKSDQSYKILLFDQVSKKMLRSVVYLCV